MKTKKIDEATIKKSNSKISPQSPGIIQKDLKVLEKFKNATGEKVTKKSKGMDHRNGIKQRKASSKYSKMFTLDTSKMNNLQLEHTVSYNVKTLSKIKGRERFLTEDLFGEAEDFTPDFIYSDNYEFHDESESHFDEGETIEESRKPAWEDDDDDDLRRAQNVENFCDIFGEEPLWAKTKCEVSDDLHLERTANVFQKDNSRKSSSIEMCNDLNKDSNGEGSIIHCVEFNLKFEVSLVAGCSNDTHGCATLFQVDGINNHKIQSIKFPKFPIKCGQFLSDGRKFIVGSSLYGHFYCCDMESGKKTRIAPSLDKNSNSRKTFKVSPCGQFIAFLGSQGNIDLVDAKTFEYIHVFRVPGVVTALDFSNDGQILYTHSVNGKVHIFDVARRSCIHSFVDDGCLNGTSIAVSNMGALACGSSSGIVNIYNKSTYMNSTSPVPFKELKKLVTHATQLKFNPTGDILATASGYKDNAARLAHLPSAMYFDNFPQTYNLFKVNSLSFSPGGGFLAVGNNKGSAKLFKLAAYDSY